MTLVIAGHSLEKGCFGVESDYVNGLFAASDSSITTGNTTLVSGFKKVVEIPVRVKALNFCDHWFNGYLGYRYDGACFVAFAGSTLVAQHIMNSIRNHLGDIYPTHEEGEYKLVMSCEVHRHLEQMDYDESMFLDRHLDQLLSAKFISDVVCHSIQAVLDQAKKHDGMRKNFAAFQAEFILGVCCPLDNDFYLFQYEIRPDGNNGAVVYMENIPKGSVAVIGMKERYAEEATLNFQDAIKNGQPTASKMHEFVIEAIESQNSIGIFSIGKPCALYLYKDNYVNLEKYTR
ncbi:hypothetical protein [Methylophaga sp.]|uniref:hypothetical protein n=1 Tax=Methylophaga sp. TaxID=2024840 RepID=UPI003A945969